MAVSTMFDRLHSVFNGCKPGVVPWMGDLTYWYEAKRKQGQLLPKYCKTNGLLQLHRDLGIGVFCHYDLVYAIEYDGVNIETTQEENKSYVLYKTPYGTLQSATKYLPKSYCLSQVEYPVKTVDDVKILRHMIESARIKVSFSKIESAMEEWRDIGTPVLLLPRSPISSIINEWAGLEAAVFLEVDHHSEFWRVVKDMEVLQDKIYELLVDGPYDFAEFPDNLSGSIIGRWFPEYNVPYYHRRCKELEGKWIGAHVDGTLRGVIEHIAESGLDFIEAVTPEPVGDINVRELRNIVGPGIVIWGCVPGSMFSAPFSRDSVERHVRNVLDVFSDDPYFVLGTADQVPPDGDIELVKAVSDIVESD